VEHMPGGMIDASDHRDPHRRGQRVRHPAFGWRMPGTWRSWVRVQAASHLRPSGRASTAGARVGRSTANAQRFAEPEPEPGNSGGIAATPRGSGRWMVCTTTAPGSRCSSASGSRSGVT
jgi:hypothetical protein